MQGWRIAAEQEGEVKFYLNSKGDLSHGLQNMPSQIFTIVHFIVHVMISSTYHHLTSFDLIYNHILNFKTFNDFSWLFSDILWLSWHFNLHVTSCNLCCSLGFSCLHLGSLHPSNFFQILREIKFGQLSITNTDIAGIKEAQKYWQYSKVLAIL